MKWSFRIARVSGIDIRVHVTFALIVALFAIDFGRSHGGFGALFGALLVCCLFLCVVLHELGHSLVAQAFGVSVTEIVLLPIGGMARLVKEPKKPLHELLIALAGPLVNGVIALVLVVIGLLSFGAEWFLQGGGVESATQPSLAALVRAWFSSLAQPSPSTLLRGLLVGNVMVAIFNMVPALPMDGGRVFRAALTMLVGRTRATRIAALVGQILAAGLSVLGIIAHDPLLAAVGVFVFLGATQERLSSQAGEVLSALRAGDVVKLNPAVLTPSDVLGTALGHMLRTEQTHFPVVHGEQLLGVLSREEALRAISRLGSEAYVTGLIQRGIREIDANLPLDQVRAHIIENGGRPVVVRSQDGYLGLLSFEDIARVVRLAARLEKSRVLLAADRSRSGAPLG